MADDPLAQAQAATDWEDPNQADQLTRARRATDWVTPPSSGLTGYVQGAMEGINNLAANVVMAPLRASAWLTGTQGRGLEGLGTQALDPYLNLPESTNAANRYGRASGQAIAMAVPVTGALTRAGHTMAALAPTTTARGVAQVVGRPYATAPGAAVATDALSATGAGLAQQGAEDAGLGPTGLMAAGILGGVAPVVAQAGIGNAVRAVRGARASSDPYNRLANGLGDTSVNDMTAAMATGAGRADDAISGRVLSTLGEKMVRANGNRQQAVAAALARLETEGGITPAAARAQLNRVIAAQADSPLLFGEYPAVASANMETRLTRPSASAQELIDALGPDGVMNLGMAGSRNAIVRLMATLGVSRKVARNRLVAAREAMGQETRAGQMESSGTHNLIDYVANTGTMASSQNVRNAVGGRSADLETATRQAIQSLAPDGRTITDVDDMLAAARRLASQEYDNVYRGPGGPQVNYNLMHGLLQRAVDRALSRAAGRGDDQAAALRQAVNRFFTEVPVGAGPRDAVMDLQDRMAVVQQVVREMRRQRRPQNEIDDATRAVDALREDLRRARRDVAETADTVLMPTLQQAQDMRAGVRGQITEARNSGRADIVQMLQPFYSDVSRIMRRASPTWARANARWADLELREMAQELGEAFATRAGPRYREQMERFQQLAPEAQNIVRVHFVQQLLDRIENAAKLGGGKNLGELFTHAHTRHMIRAILGNDAAMQVARLVRDSNTIARSRNMLSGSQTHMRKQVQGEQDNDLGILAAAAQGNWSNWRAALVQHAIAFMRERRNKVLGRAITTPMSDTAGVAENLERMRRAQQRVAAYTNPAPRPVGLGGIYGSTPAPYLPD